MLIRDVMTAGQLVYLTADSPNTLTHLDKESVYIIGGLVDRNAQKGMCVKKANVRNPCISSSVVPRHLALYERMMERCVVIIQRVYPWFWKARFVSPVLRAILRFRLVWLMPSR